MSLFEADFDFAINKIAYSNLWKAQKLLFSKIYAHYTKVKSLNNDKDRNIDNIKIANVVSFFLLI